jgi:hypothetical protein
MHPEASSDSGKMNNSMQFRRIEVQLALNWPAGYNLMAAIAGLPNFDSYLYSQKLPFLNLSFHYALFFMHTWDCILAEIRYRQFMISFKLQAVKISTGWEFAGH